MRDDYPTLRIIQIGLAVALLGSLFAAGERVYRSLPSTSPTEASDSSQSQLTIILRDSVSGPPAETQIEIYPLDYSATQRDFLTNGRPGRNLEEYLAQRLKSLDPVRVKIDQNGRAVTRLRAGAWWMRATSSFRNGEVIEWREPLTISRSAHTVELSPENAYERRKTF